MHRIHFENRFIAVCPPTDHLRDDPEALIISDTSVKSISSLPDLFDSRKEYDKLVILTDDEEDTFRRLCGALKEIKAGGGLVRNSCGEYLMIQRKGLWDLPKGKLEDGESIEECALREVSEETGIDGCTLGSLICITHHTYRMFGQFFLKHTYWYNMEYSLDAVPAPQTEEGITKAIWVAKDRLKDCLSNTYASIREVFEEASVL